MVLRFAICKSALDLQCKLRLITIHQLANGTISYGIGHTHTAIASWRLLFLILGGFTFLWGICLLLFLPDSPLKARFLNEKEKYIALHRIRSNKTGVENKVPPKLPPVAQFSSYKRTNKLSDHQMVSGQRVSDRPAHLSTRLLCHLYQLHQRSHWRVFGTNCVELRLWNPSDRVTEYSNWCHHDYQRITCLHSQSLVEKYASQNLCSVRDSTPDSHFVDQKLVHPSPSSFIWLRSPCESSD